jgi:hypothetical protein
MFGLRLASAAFFLTTRCFHGFPDLLRIGGGLMLVARKPIASVRKCHVYTITHLQSTNECGQGDMSCLNAVDTSFVCDKHVTN